MSKKGYLVCFILLVLILFNLSILSIFTAGLFSPMPFRILDSFSGKVIDIETKEPIEGAAVLAVYYKETYTIAGSNSWVIDAQETLTDGNGEFEIPFRMRWFRLYRGSTEGRLIIFKPEYGVFPDHKLSNAIGENKSWPSSGKYIVFEVPKLKTWEERDNNIHFSRPNINNKLMKEFIKSLNMERGYLGYDPFTIDAKEE